MNKKQTVSEVSVQPNGRMLTGTVISTKMEKTVVVAVTVLYRHPLYKKTVRKTRSFKAHNEIEGISEKDMVRIQEVPPMSKTVHFIVREKITV